MMNSLRWQTTTPKNELMCSYHDQFPKYVKFVLLQWLDS